MKQADMRAEDTGSCWWEALILALDLGLAPTFDIEWIIDRTERSGRWA